MTTAINVKQHLLLLKEERVLASLRAELSGPQLG